MSAINQNVVMFALITHKKDRVTSGMAPVFFADDEQESQRIALWISRITGADVHDLQNGVLMLTVSPSSS